MRSPDGRIFDITQLPAPAWPTPRAQPPDPEKAAKFSRLYTEGLEAFYLGQWETAFQKFQAIIDSNPDHKEAADKLEIARKKMQVQALNGQAQNAEKAGDWDQAVQTLDKLAAADPGFPEIAERTTRARRQAQLADLYAEARQLAEAEKWQAIPGMFREIDQLSPRYPDPDDLRNRAQQQVAKSKREAELDSAYTAALRAFEGSDWNTAIRHLRHVRRLDPGYRETDQLLRRAEVEIEHKRTASRRSEVNARSAPGGNHETLLLQLFLFAALANLAARLLVERLILPAVQDPYLTQLANLIPQSAIAGVIVLWLLSKSVGRLDWRKTLVLMAFIIVFQTAAVELGIWIDPGYQGWVWRAVGFIMGISMALPAAIFIRKMKEQTNWPTLVLIATGWGISFIIGQILAIRITGGFGTLPTFGVYVGIEQAITAFLGGWITIAALEGIGLWPINWKTVLLGALGWGLGNLVVNAAFLKAEAQWLLIPQAALWGFIGAGALAYPSRNIKKYILLGILGATGMSLAQVLTQVFPGLHGPWLLGGLAGLFIGLATKKASKMMALAITGLIALTMRMAMVFLYNENIDPAKTASLPVLAITAAIAGAILAIGWCYFRGEKAALPAAKGTPQ
jgi:tetratricopeptide (TPR) repeat protein